MGAYTRDTTLSSLAQILKKKYIKDSRLYLGVTDNFKTLDPCTTQHMEYISFEREIETKFTNSLYNIALISESKPYVFSKEWLKLIEGYNENKEYLVDIFIYNNEDIAEDEFINLVNENFKELITKDNTEIVNKTSQNNKVSLFATTIKGVHLESVSLLDAMEKFAPEHYCKFNVIEKVLLYFPRGNMEETKKEYIAKREEFFKQYPEIQKKYNKDKEIWEKCLTNSLNINKV